MPKIKEKKLRKTLKEKILENLRAVGEAYVIAFFIRLLFIEAFAIPTGSMIPNIMIGDRIIVFKPTYGINLPFIDYKLPGFFKPHRGDIIVFKNPTYRSPGKLRELITLLTFSVINLDKEPKYFVKRVLGIPGDELTIVSNRIYIDNKPLEYRLTKREYPFEYYLELGYNIRFKLNIDSYEGIVTDFSISNLASIYVSNFRDLLLSRGIPEIYLPNLDFFEGNLEEVVSSLSSNIIPKGYYFVMGDNRDESFDSRYWGLVPENLIIGKAIFRFWPPNRIGIPQ